MAIVLVVLFVFSEIHERNQTVVVAILGLIYVAIRQMHLSRFLETGPILIQIAKKIDDLGLLAERAPTTATGGQKVFGQSDEDETEPVSKELEALYADLEGELQINTVRIYINSVFLTVIVLICIYQLFTSL